MKLASSVACVQELSLEHFFLISLILFQVLECAESYVHISFLPRPPLPFLSLFNISLSLSLSLSVFSTPTLAETFFLRNVYFSDFLFIFSFLDQVLSRFFNIASFFSVLQHGPFPFYRHVSLPSAA